MTNPLYNNTETPFKDWPVEVQNEFFQATAVRGEDWFELWNCEEWVRLDGVPDFCLDAIYRLFPPEPIPDTVDWSVFTDDVTCMARDKDDETHASTGAMIKAGGFWSHQSGELIRINNIASYKRGNLPWDQSLVWRPGCEPEGEE